MGDYEDVDREIHDFLAQKRSSVYKTPAAGGRPTVDVLPLLESLSKTYSEINAHLRTENAEALKDVILKSDIKMSMVCETLLETLKKTTEEKRDLLAENTGLSKLKRELEERESVGRIHKNRLEQDLECKNTNINELNRIIKDQKDRIAEYRKESLRIKSDFAINKTKLDELENLKSRAAEKLGVYEREMEAIKDVIGERDEAIRGLVREKKAEEDRNGAVKTKICECERMIEILNKKLESKENNLNLCNDELSKVLAENKAMKGDFEKYRDGFVYYERLYNTLNKQNGYLNSQLNKMLRSGDKDSVAFIRKYKLKNKKNKRMLRQREEENAALRNKLEMVKEEMRECRASDTFNTESSEPLIKRIEELTGTNKELKKRVNELEAEKRMAERKMPGQERGGESQSKPAQAGDYRGEHGLDARPAFKAGAYQPSFERRRSDYQPDHNNLSRFQCENRPSHYHSSLLGNNPYLSTQTVKKDYLSDYAGVRPANYHFDKESKSFNEIFSSPNFINPMMVELKKQPDEYKSYSKPNLENDYEEKEMGNLLGGFEDGLRAEKSAVGDKPRDGTHTGLRGANAPVRIGADSGLFNQPNNAGMGYQNGGPGRITDRGGQAAYGEKEPAKMSPKNNISNSLVENPFTEENSTESVKTYHTTSTLKDMIARTDKLQRKFESLEEQLANIKEGDTEDRLVGKIKTYNTHCSELNIDSNDSDFI